jgi:hypothetical protein
VQGRFFGQLGPEGFQKALPLPAGELRVMRSTRPGWVYLLRNAGGEGRLYGVWDNGTMSTLAEFPSPIRAVADDAERTYVATDDALFAVNDHSVEVISKTTADFGPVSALATGGGLIFATANRRVYVLSGDTLLALVKGVAPQLAVAGRTLYCWEPSRRLLFRLDIGALYDQ